MSKPQAKPNSSPTRVTPVSRPGNRQGSQKAADKKETPAPVYNIDDYTKECPPGLYRLFISRGMQAQLNIKTDEDVTQEDNIKKVSKQALIDDMTTKMGISDFAPLKKQIEEYPEDEITIVYDYDFTYDKNFFLCLTAEIRDIVDNPPLVIVDQGSFEKPRYVPPPSKPWVSHGSEKDIDEKNFSYKRPLFKYKVKINRENLKRTPKMTDVDADSKKGMSVTIASFADASFETTVIEIEKDIQAAPFLVDSSAQTVWRFPKNANTQYEPRFIKEQEQKKILNSPELANFMKDSLSLLESALQQNLMFDSFENDWLLLGDEMSAIGGPGDLHLKEYQSFTDIHNSKNKIVTSVQWHPTLKGIVAMSLAANYPLYERLDNLGKSVIAPSLILIWSFVDPIQPKLLLEAPDDIFSFAFSPTEPHIIAGGCLNGQVVLWDISPWEDRIKNPRGDHRDKDLFIPGFEEESFFQTPRIRYCASSYHEFGHNHPITDIQWIPEHFEIDRMGFPTESKSSVCCQLMTAAVDHQILFWDTRSKTQNAKKKDIDLPMNVPQTFKHLAGWRPILKVSLPCSDPVGDFAPTKFSISEKHGDKSIIDYENRMEIEKREDGKKDAGQFVAGTGKVGGKARLLQHLNTKISIGTEDGQYVYVDWLPQKEADSAKLITSKAEWYTFVLDGPVVAMKRSPFFKDILIVAGGGGFTIWREKTFSGALLQTKSFSKRITDAEWSPTRPGVFFIAKADGTIDIWDLLDRTHAPVLTQSISIHKLSFINCKAISPKQQLIAIGDTVGTLNIMEVPWALRRTISGELQAVKTYFQRETKRREYVKQRWDFREEEKREMERQAALKAGMGPPHIPTEDEITFKLRNEFNEYLQFEAAVLRELGLRDEDDTPVLIS